MVRTRQPALVVHGLAFPAARLPVRRTRENPEEHFLQKVVSFARLYGWDYHHEHDSRRSTPGWPDLELVRPPRHIRAELKVHESDRELKGEQRRINEVLRQVPGLEVYVWTPRDLDSGLITHILARRT